MPFEWSVVTVERGLNFPLSTQLGPIDLLGEIVGGGVFEELLPATIEVEAFGIRCHCLALPGLIRARRAAGRPRDLEAIAELALLSEESAEDDEG